MTKLKICGLMDASHALAAAKGGADYLGFVFVPGVRRRLEVDQARDIIEKFRRVNGPGGPKLVGLFADQPLGEVNHILLYCGLDLAQLCGGEPPQYWGGVERPVIKQVKVSDSGPQEEVVQQVCQSVERVISSGHICMLDRYEEGAPGGTGRPFDWAIAGAVAQRYPFLLAGGLTPSNVANAIETVRPWGVDVSSGVETDGVKDVAKISAFCLAVRSVSVETKG